MKNEIQFKEFPKIARLSREIIITEKIDGTNASITILEDSKLLAGSRTRFITVDDDNFGFARFCVDNYRELMKLGIGTHFGEWWGSGIQRGYDLEKGERRFSLFNVSKWSDDALRPTCCSVVPILFKGSFDTANINITLEVLRIDGSRAARGFMNAEGIIIFHADSNSLFKKTLYKDELSKHQIHAEKK